MVKHALPPAAKVRLLGVLSFARVAIAREIRRCRL
jgi:hypothetical protein